MGVMIQGYLEGLIPLNCNLSRKMGIREAEASPPSIPIAAIGLGFDGEKPLPE